LRDLFSCTLRIANSLGKGPEKNLSSKFGSEVTEMIFLISGRIIGIFPYSRRRKMGVNIEKKYKYTN